MKVYLVRERKNINAVGEYDMETKALTVKKGSRVSEGIAYTEKFRGAKTIEKDRAGTVKTILLQKILALKVHPQQQTLLQVAVRMA